MGFVWGCVLPFNRVLAKVPGYGRFSSPLRRLRNFYIPPFIEGHSLSQLRCQLPQRGSRGWAVPFIGVLAKIRGYGRFSSPLRRAGVIHCSTCPLCVRFSFPGCRSPGGFWTASSRSPGTCRPGFPWPPSGALPGSWWGRRSRWRCRRGGGGR